MSTYIYEKPLVRQPKTIYRERKHALLVMKGKNSTSYFELFRICDYWLSAYYTSVFVLQNGTTLSQLHQGPPFVLISPA